MHFRDLHEDQILALAVTAEEEDARIYRDFAESLRSDFPATAELFTRMAGPAGSDMQMFPPTVAAFQILNEARNASQHWRTSGIARHSAGPVLR